MHRSSSENLDLSLVGSQVSSGRKSKPATSVSSRGHGTMHPPRPTSSTTGGAAAARNSLTKKKTPATKKPWASSDSNLYDASNYDSDRTSSSRSQRRGVVNDNHAPSDRATNHHKDVDFMSLFDGAGAKTKKMTPGLKNSASGSRPPSGAVRVMWEDPPPPTDAQDATKLNLNFLQNDETAPQRNHGVKTRADHAPPKPRQDVDASAAKIQNWFRKRMTPRAVADGYGAEQDAVRTLLQEKRRQREEVLLMEQKQFEKEQRVFEDRRRAREEKAKHARHAAIQDLQQRREEQKQANKQTSEEEVRRLKSAGKIAKKQPKTGAASKTPSRSAADVPAGPKTREDRRGSGGEMEIVDIETDRFDTPSSTDRRVADIFGKTPDVPASKTTLDDLLSTLKELEKPEILPEPEQTEDEVSASSRTAWIDEIEREVSEAFREAEKPPAPVTHDPHHHPGPYRKQPTAGSNAVNLTQDKIKNIMDFLEEVDKVEENLERTGQEERGATGAAAQTIGPSHDERVQMEQASLAASEITSTMLKQKLELDEKQRNVGLLQKALNQQRELTVCHAKEQDKEMNRRLKVQKDEYETTIQRHLSFIDQLIDDKKSLSDKCEQFLKELKDVDKKYSTRIKTLTDSQQTELKKIKDTNAAAEKMRREKWIEEKTKKIKEITVKGLEPEIQKLISQHKSEMKKMKAIHEAEMLQAEERAGGKYVRQTEELRDQLADEKERACTRERDLAREMYEKQMHEEASTYQQQRQRLHSEVQEEKARLSELAARQRAELDRQQKQLEESNKKAIETMRVEYERARDEQERRHSLEVRELQERLSIEKQAWEENYMKKQESWLSQKERELKDKVRTDRDKEIELVINRLEDETQKTRDEAERTAENRIRRIRDKYESEIRELEHSERETLQRHNELKSRLGDVEGENARLRSTVSQKDKDIADIDKVKERLTRERDNLSDVIRQEFADRLVTTEDENRRLKTDMSELKAKHRLEIQRITTEKTEEMDEVHKRVKQAIVKKEETVNTLKQQHQSALKRADHLESLLEQQRKQLLGK